MVEMHALLGATCLHILLPCTLYDAGGLRFTCGLGQLREEEGSGVRSKQGHVAEQLFEWGMRVGRIGAAQVILGVEHEGRLAPDERPLVAYLQRLGALNGIIGTRGGT